MEGIKMEQMDWAELAETVQRIRRDHPLKKDLFMGTDLVRNNDRIDRQLMDAGRLMILSRFVNDFWRYANDAILFLRRGEADAGNVDAEERFVQWLSDSAVPFLDSLSRRTKVTGWDNLVSFYYILDNRIDALDKVGKPELPVFLIETIHTLKERLTNKGLTAFSD